MTEIMSTDETTTEAAARTAKVIVRLFVVRMTIGCLPVLIGGIDGLARMKEAIHKR